MRTRLYLFILLAFAHLAASAHSVVKRDGYYEVQHSWEYKGKSCSVMLNISTALYDYYQNDREHHFYRYHFNGSMVPPNYFGFMLSERDRGVIRALAQEFSNGVDTEAERIALALSFVQSLTHAFDTESKGDDEYVRYPIETLVDGCGDCEDKVSLLAALLYEMDADFVLLLLPEHMAVGVHCDGVMADRYMLFRGKKYYYLETTMPEWRIGQIPEDYASAEMEVVSVDETPTLLVKGVRFESHPCRSFEKADCDLEVELHNLGPGEVKDVVLHVRVVEKGMNRLLAEEYFSLQDLQEGEHRTEKVSVVSLIKENSVLEMELTGTGITPLYYEYEMNYSRVRRR